jgi:hypothetical protein
MDWSLSAYNAPPFGEPSGIAMICWRVHPVRIGTRRHDGQISQRHVGYLGVTFDHLAQMSRAEAGSVHDLVPFSTAPARGATSPTCHAQQSVERKSQGFARVRKWRCSTQQRAQMVASNSHGASTATNHVDGTNTPAQTMQ